MPIAFEQIEGGAHGYYPFEDKQIALDEGKSELQTLKTASARMAPDEHTTHEKITTPRGSFSVTDMTREQMEAAGYGVHHMSDDGKHLIMGNGTQAFAVAAENPIKHVEDTIEQNDNKLDGIINNTPETSTVDALEAKAKAGRADLPCRSCKCN